MKLSKNAKKAILIGTLCSVSYLAVYIARNVLTAVSVELSQDQIVDKTFYGVLTTAYFWFYAVGQLVNGLIGQKVNARWMISLGLLFAGILNFTFPYIVVNQFTAILVYGMSGFFLAMVYSPMTKVVAENTLPIHATRCSLGYTFASFFGSPIAGVLASFFVWSAVFTVSSVMLVLMAIVVFVFFLFFERKGIVKYNLYKPKNENGNAVRVLIKHSYLKFCLISFITGIVRTGWITLIPEYFFECLGYTESQAEGVFSIVTLIISFTTFISIFIYERLKRNINKTLSLTFGLALIFFIAVLFIVHPVVSVVLMVVAIMSSNAAATMLWSVYCPSLRDTGFTSGATGFLDFINYMAAGVFTLVIGLLRDNNLINLNQTVIILIVLMALGLGVSLYVKKNKKEINS